jgi:benzoylformate decarboxylase
MDFVDPPVDFAAVARGLGLEAMRIDAPDGLKALSDAFRNPAPKLIEVVVDGSL